MSQVIYTVIEYPIYAHFSEFLKTDFMTEYFYMCLVFCPCYIWKTYNGMTIPDYCYHFVASTRVWRVASRDLLLHWAIKID